MDVLSKDKKALLIGNDAIVRGALEAGVSFAAAYPGTPSSEIADTFSAIAKDVGMYFEYSVNEKVSLEVCAAAAITGFRSLTCMKHVGVNVAADALLTYAYVGCKAGHIIVSADDPECHSSQNEQDNRYYATLANLPMLEPSTPQECKDMAKEGYGISEKLALPLLLRTTTRINHTSSVVELGEMKAPKPRGTGQFEKDPLLVSVPSVARARHPILLKKMERAEEMAENSPFNRTIEFSGKSAGGAGKPDAGKIGIITSGVSYCYVADVLRELGVEMRVLKLGFTHPMPKKMVAEFVKSCDAVLVVEELEPYLEEQIKALAYEIGAKTRILGKGTGHFTRLYEYNTDIVRRGIEAAINGESESRRVIESIESKSLKSPESHLKYEVGSGNAEVASDIKPPTSNFGRLQDSKTYPIIEMDSKTSGLVLPSRPPVLCPGCPHRATYYAVKQAAKGKSVIYPTDIGCYTLGRGPPLNMADYLLCMGSSVGTACGFSVATSNHIVAFLGDSTFFHAGIPPLVNAVHNKERFVLAILDNRTTAMTGHQPNPGTDKDGMGYEAPAIQLEGLVKGCGVEFVRTVDPRNLKETVQAFKEALEFPKVSVIISRSPCILLKGAASKQKYEVVQETCKKCKICVSQFACPAFQMDKEQIKIDQGLCTGCGVCAQVCPFDAIKPKGDTENRESRTAKRGD
ncbi:MAG: indolepyruvate ferredoxin oxidoreductase subunit alpha [Thermoplasmata archaeon HGW-Thermoplasmata-2]|nr:MAG: indolepyruvate ferredoxin oxidoreductase subunit alpha [Thermoplasmata archaeon HGW-Thermoplasmata-2]